MDDQTPQQEVQQVNSVPEQVSTAAASTPVIVEPSQQRPLTHENYFFPGNDPVPSFSVEATSLEEAQQKYVDFLATFKPGW